MDEFNKMFDHLRDYKVTVCKECQYCVQPTQVKGQLSSHHTHIPSPTRKAVQEYIQTMDDIAQQKEEVKYPDPEANSVIGMPVYNDGLVCFSEQEGHKCTFVCRSIIHMQKHCKETHGWINSQKRGGNVKAKQQHSANKLWVEKQYCQRFFKQGSWQQYFQVMKGDNPEDENQDTTEETRRIVRRERRC